MAIPMTVTVRVDEVVCAGCCMVRPKRVMVDGRCDSCRAKGRTRKAERKLAKAKAAGGGNGNA